MADIVNLRLVRKAKARQDRDAAAASNRLTFGRSKAERLETAMRGERAERFLDGHRRKPSGDDA